MPKHKVRSGDIRRMSREEREKLLRELKMELVSLRYKARAGLLEDVGRIRELRRNIARILTIMREEELGRAKEEA